MDCLGLGTRQAEGPGGLLTLEAVGVTADGEPRGQRQKSQGDRACILNAILVHREGELASPEVGFCDFGCRQLSCGSSLRKAFRIMQQLQAASQFLKEGQNLQKKKIQR